MMEESKYYEYLLKIDQDRHMFNELFFNVIDKENIVKTSLLSEYHSLLFHIEDLLLQIEDLHSPKEKQFYVNKEAALKLSVLLSALMTVKEELLKQNVSLSIH